MKPEVRRLLEETSTEYHRRNRSTDSSIYSVDDANQWGDACVVLVAYALIFGPILFGIAVVICALVGDTTEGA